MTFILLTGAGFSYNWGGPLASEIFNAVLADQSIDDHTRELLFASRGAFESVLADLQTSSDPEDQKRYGALITSVVGIFNGMNQTFMRTPFEFENPPSVQHSLASFLSRFHTLFTLNQDALIELHYNPMIGPPMNWGRLHLPGMKYLQPYRLGGTLHDKFTIMEPNPTDNTFPTHAQPYVKLHGSVNWVESNVGSRILIMGGQKAVSIGRFPILKWYQDEFRNILLRPNARLMIIGYGFGDSHINDAIAEGLQAGLKIFVVDPLALDVIKKDSRIDGAPRKQFIGFSNRPLTRIFGGDRYGHAEVSKFFDP
jgi:hypothetical protein